MKNNKTIIIAVVILAILFIAAKDPLDFLRKPMAEDTNVSVLPLEADIVQGDIVFTIDRLEAGDNYTAIHYTMSEFRPGEQLKGAQMLKDGELLKILDNSYNSKEGGYIYYEPVENLSNIVLRTANITNTQMLIYDFPLEFVDNVCEFEAEVDGAIGLLIVTVRENGVGVATHNIETLHGSETETRTKIPQNFMFYNIDPEKGEPFNIDNPPSHLRITVTKYTVDEKPFEIKIS